MYKVVGEERFLLWAVCSIQLQVLCGEGGEKLLLLAEALLKKHIASHSLHEPEALLVYISLLEQQAKYETALEILSGKLGCLVAIEGDRLRIQGRLLARARDYAAAADVFQKVLESSPDDWEAFLHYLNCLLEDDSSWCQVTTSNTLCSPKFVDSNICKSPHLTDEMFDSRISGATLFVQKLQAEAKNEHIRGPYLANLEIEKRRRLYGKDDNGKLMEVLLQYFYKFGHLACFTSDVEVFLQVLTHNEKMELLKEIFKSCESPSPSTVKALGKAITSFRIQESIGAMSKLPVCELESTASRMIEMYFKNLPLSKELDPQENMHGEELLTMACNVLVQLFWRTRHLGYLLEGVMVLEFGLTIRRYIWQYRILLLHLYSFLGALPSALEWYRTLEIKNILLETASHHILPQMLRSPLWSDLTDLLNEYLKFMEDHFQEAADLTFLAYRHRNYTKAIDFVQFRERLQHSHQYLMARIEAPILQLKQKADNLEEIECIFGNLKHGIQVLELSSEEHLKSLMFNEDMQSRPWWSPAPDKNYLLEPFEGENFYPGVNMGKQQAKEWEANQHKAIERRSLLPRLICLSVQIASSSHKEHIETNGSVHDGKISSDLKLLLEQFARSLGLSFNDAIEVIAGISDGYKSFKEYGSDMLDWMNFAIFVNAWNLSQDLGLPDGDGSRTNSWRIVNNLMEKWADEQLQSAQPILTYPGEDLLILVQMVTEPFYWHSLVIQSCVRSLLPTAGKKKKKSSGTDQSHSPLSQAVRSSIQSLCKAAEKVMKWLEDQHNKPEDEKLNNLLSLIQINGSEMGPGHVFQLLEAMASTPHPQVGERVFQAIQTWSSADVVRGIVRSQSTVLSEFRCACSSRLKSMASALKQLV
ncbi:N-terminal acetyltransferase B complex auxiliary subunit NAA25 isoform X2 [Magnolia sinica]|nr:N-terminal acetyltransferase B complex auxiliary subunit NAA25 isoform X2 [Magnolia sinica]XP_058110430.1 N-terminal acetyltransferase B complex auxiliary subunit NAA25 isoform X2 [Magnolia sinica]